MKRTRLLLLLALLMTATTGAWAQSNTTTYKVKVNDGGKDAANWTANPAAATTDGVAEGTAVTLKYNGRLRVKDVTATTDAAPWTGDLANIPAWVLQADRKTLIVPDGMTLTGELSQKYKIQIADGATVTLDGVTINGNSVNDANCPWAGITCAGSATIVLKDGTTNTVKGFYEDYPGIYVPQQKTLTIQGNTGKLKTSPYDGGGTKNSFASGIGGGLQIACGNILIKGGDIEATGGRGSAGIGSGWKSVCGTITIAGGTVTATGGQQAAGIGSGDDATASCGDITITAGNVTANGSAGAAAIGSGTSAVCGNITISGGTVMATGADDARVGIGSGYNGGKCGDITITDGVTSLTATRAYNVLYSIGANNSGSSTTSTCGTVTIGGVEYWKDNAAVDDAAAEFLKRSTIIYPKWDGNMANIQPWVLQTDGKTLIATDGMTLTGELTQKYKILIADGATVTLDGVTIKGSNDKESVNQTGLYPWAGITCEGDATIVLKDGTTNTVKGFYEDYPGIQAGPEEKTLTIQGTGQLTASSNGHGAGIGGGRSIACGNIVIAEATITATGGENAAGIGGGYNASCGTITINSGTVEASGTLYGAGIGSGGHTDTGCGTITINAGIVEATGGKHAAGIGGGHGSRCGDITISADVTWVTAYKGEHTEYSIGLGHESSICGTITIGGTATDQSEFTTSPYIYQPGN